MILLRIKYNKFYFGEKVEQQMGIVKKEDKTGLGGGGGVSAEGITVIKKSFMRNRTDVHCKKRSPIFPSLAGSREPKTPWPGKTKLFPTKGV
jgi:hypothetical protein